VRGIEPDLVAMTKRLFSQEWFTSHNSGLLLIGHFYALVSRENQEQLMALFMKGVNHENNSVRKTAAEVLNTLIPQIPRAPEAELLNVLQELQKDDQDIVKMAGVESLILFAEKLSSSKINSYLIPLFKKFGEASSWRIRFLVAEKITSLGKAFGKEIAQTRLVPLYVGFLKDTESEVRTAALAHLGGFSDLIDTDVVVSKIVPNLSDLATDSFQYVRIALAENLL
jgi:serine/threonine-protein phosphatase 2A regulatory subunit A